MFNPDLKNTLKLLFSIFSASSLTADAIDIEISITAPNEPITMLDQSIALKSMGLSGLIIKRNMES
ncbi:hypothetical protein SDC9_197546 [bioreactor metagenome]|uniref:Uncharacterized protein n=1 Tax=bioreactor metagenome TaxID=1076179 RepID=A0A645IGF0_9ZZZZ